MEPDTDVHFWDSTKVGHAACGARQSGVRLTDKTPDVTCRYCQIRREFFAGQYDESLLGNDLEESHGSQQSDEN